MLDAHAAEADKDRQDREGPRSYLSLSLQVMQSRLYRGTRRRHAIIGTARRKPVLLTTRSSVSRLVSVLSSPLDVMDLRSIWGSDNQNVGSADKETGLNHTGNPMERCFQLIGSVDPCQMDIHNQVARLGLEACALSFPKDDAASGELPQFSVPCCATRRGRLPQATERRLPTPGPAW